MVGKILALEGTVVSGTEARHIWGLGLFRVTDHPNLPNSQWVSGNQRRTGDLTGGLELECITQLTLSDNLEYSM